MQRLHGWKKIMSIVCPSKTSGRIFDMPSYANNDR